LFSDRVGRRKRRKSKGRAASAQAGKSGGRTLPPGFPYTLPIMRVTSRTDRLIAMLDQGLRAVAAAVPAGRRSPAAAQPEAGLSAAERQESARLLRVNRAGEIAAQALYSAQALFARDPATAGHLRQAAAEENDHLAWCSERLAELGGRRSLLDPFWFIGSTLIGALAGLAGDRASLGFVAETEKQVEAHIDRHLARLPAADARSRAVLEQMAADEARHGRAATAAGGAPIREPVRSLMAVTGGCFRRISYYL
jgi:ubiquinone biosynthesis monooxygenase Coq7